MEAGVPAKPTSVICGRLLLAAWVVLMGWADSLVSGVMAAPLTTKAVLAVSASSVRRRAAISADSTCKTSPATPVFVLVRVMVAAAAPLVTHSTPPSRRTV